MKLTPGSATCLPGIIFDSAEEMCQYYRDQEAIRRREQAQQLREREVAALERIARNTTPWWGS